MANELDAKTLYGGASAGDSGPDIGAPTPLPFSPKHGCERRVEHLKAIPLNLNGGPDATQPGKPLTKRFFISATPTHARITIEP